MGAEAGGGVDIPLAGPWLTAASQLVQVLEGTEAKGRRALAEAFLDRRGEAKDWRRNVLSLQVPIAARAVATVGSDGDRAFLNELAVRFRDWAMRMPQPVVHAAAMEFPAGRLRAKIGEALLGTMRATPEESEREKAMEVICEIEPREVTGLMVSALKADPERQVRRMLALLLGILHEEVDEIIRAHDRDPDEEVQFSCRVALGLSSDPRGLRKLLKIGASDDTAGVTISLLSHKTTEARAALLKLALSNPEEVLIEMSANEVSEGESELPDLSELKTPALVARLLKMLKSREDDQRCIALMLLGAAGVQEAVDPLIEFLGDEDILMKAEAAVALGRLKAAAAVDHLIPVVGTFSEASRALSRIGASRAAPALVKALTRSKEVSCRAAAAEALGTLGGSAAQAGLLKGLEDREPRVRQEVIKALAAMKGAGEEDMVPLLRDRTPSVRAAAARAVGDLGCVGGIEELLALSSDADDEVRGAALAALWKLSQAMPDTGLAPVTSAPDTGFLPLLFLPWDVSVEKGARLLQAAPDPQGLVAALLDYRASGPDSWVTGILKRQEPLSFALGSRTDLKPPLRSRLVRRTMAWLMAQPYPSSAFVLAAADQKSRLVADLAAQLLESHEATADPMAQSLLIASLTSLAPEVTRSPLQGLLKSRLRAVRRGVAVILASYPDQESRAALKVALKDRDRQVRGVAMAALSLEDPGDVKRLALMSKDPATEVRIEVVHTLAGSPTEQARRYLEQISRKNARGLVRLAACASLAARDRNFVPRFLEVLNASVGDLDSSRVLERIDDASGFIAEGLRGINPDGPSDLEQNVSWYLEALERSSQTAPGPGDPAEGETETESVAELVEQAGTPSGGAAIHSLWRLIDAGRVTPSAI